MKISVYATPENVLDKELKDQRVVIIDVLRATSTILTALYNGCRDIVPTIEIEEAVNISRIYEKDSFLLCGERNITAIDGFHLSNSPAEYTEDIVKGKTLLFTTTNGTRAIRKASDAGEVIIAALNNVDAVSDYLLSKEGDIVFICAGTDKKFSLDDIVAAGAVISRMVKRDPAIVVSDLAYVCRHMYESCADDIEDLLKESAHFQRMEEAGLLEDIKDCLSLNTAPVVGIFKDGVIKSVEKWTKP